MPKIEMYSTAVCPYCNRAEMLLKNKGVEIEKIMIDQDADAFKTMLSRSNGRRSVPQIFIDDRHIGGFDDLYELDMDGELDPLLVAE